MRMFVYLCAVIVLLMGGLAEAATSIRVVVDKSEQRIRVIKNGKVLYNWKVSTGKRDRWTPNGTFKVQWLSEHHRSSIYNNAPMPHSVFFNGNIATHGTYEENRLGRRASHGCVRLSRKNARTLFRLIEKNQESAIVVVKN